VEGSAEAVAAGAALGRARPLGEPLAVALPRLLAEREAEAVAQALPDGACERAGGVLGAGTAETLAVELTQAVRVGALVAGAALAVAVSECASEGDARALGACVGVAG